MEPHNSLLDILAAGNPDPMVQWICTPALPLSLWTFLLYLTSKFQLKNYATPMYLRFLVIIVSV
jgi:hypothetical protein